MATVHIWVLYTTYNYSYQYWYSLIQVIPYKYGVIIRFFAANMTRIFFKRKSL